MRKWRRYLAALLAAVMIATPAAEVYAANGAMTVSGNEPGIVVETTEEETTEEEITEEVSSVEENVEESVEESGEVVETEESSEEASEEVTTEETTEELTTEELTTEEVTTEEVTTEELTAEEMTVEANGGIGNFNRLTISEKQALYKNVNSKYGEWAKDTGRVPNGYKDVDYDIEMPDSVSGTDDSLDTVRADVVIPVSYDARNKGQVSAVKNQQAWGTCWSFSAVSAAESAYKIANNGSEINMSETHLVDFFYNENDLNYSGLRGDYTYPLQDSKVQQGGNSLFTTWGMARWTGIAKEDASLDADLIYPDYYHTLFYEDLDIDENLAFTDAMHLENAYFISFYDRSNVKRAIMEYGSVGMSYFYDATFDSDTYKEYVNSSYSGPAVYYNPYEYSTNHAVAIVGWDDTFARENFANTYWSNYTYREYGDMDLPLQDGAWLVKNSWGTEIGDGGYFWISYEDLSLDGGIAFAFDFEAADNYDNNYQYDGSNGVWTYSTGKTTTAAAVYKVNMGSQVQTLDAVGVGFASPSNEYTVKVYKDLASSSKPDSGILMTTQTGKSSFEGYYTIELDEPVELGEGERFSIVIECKNTRNASFFVDKSYTNGNWIKFKATTKAGETFFKSGSSWKDAASTYKMTMRIKAFTSNAADITATKILQDDMVEVIPAQIYTESAIKPTVKVNCEGTELTQDTHYSVAYSNNTAAGTATVTITGLGDYSGSTVTKTFDIKKKAITKDMITVNAVNYTGLAQNPVVVKNGNTVMVSKTDDPENGDYTIKYSKTPINAGSYTATITGANNYSGSVKVTVKIGKTNINDTTVSLSQTTYDYDGKAKKPAVTVGIGGQNIPATNYTIKYSANTNAGTAKVILTAKGSLSGKIEKTFTIKAKPITSDGITYSIAKATYSGSELKPAVTVKDGTKKLTLNKDYTVAYSQNVSAGENVAKATITGKGNYSGTIAQTFTIAQKTIPAKDIKAELALDGNTKKLIVKAGKITFNSSDYDYVIKKGEEDYTNKTLTVGDKYTLIITLKGNYKGTQKLKNIVCKTDLNAVTVEFSAKDAVYTYTGSAQKPKIVVKSGDKAFATSNYSVTYSNNVNVGTATVTITGKGALSGTETLNFAIQPKEVNDTLVISGVKTKTYNGKVQTQAVTVKDKTKKLKANKDYTLSYTNNTNAGTGTVTVKLSDNYTLNGTKGGSKAVTFTINPAKISSVTAKAALYTGNPVETTLTVKAGNVTLTSNDYTYVYANNTAVGNNKATVTVTAKTSNFTGSKTAKFSISKESFSKVTVTGVTDLTYKGKALTQDSIVVKNQAGTTIPSNNYTVTYKNNVNAGKATVTIKAKADSIYSGSKAVTFKVKPAELSEIMVMKDDTLYDKTYTGSKLTYKSTELKNVFTESTTGKVISTSSYKITYKNNVNAGTATMVVTGKGNYTGMKEYQFTIKPKNISSWTIDIKGSVAYNNGLVAVPTIRKMLDGKLKMVKGKDYTISCSGATDIGVARITVTGRGNYEGSRSFMYTVK